jgi:hypothetical protein
MSAIFVRWVEWSEPHHPAENNDEMVGLASLDPPYCLPSRGNS